MNTITRNLMVFCAILSAMMFGNSETKVTGEFSSAITFSDSVSFTTPYTGITISGTNWELSTNLTDGEVIIEEAKYNWAVTDKVTATFGSQALPYGVAWGLHRPSSNSFVSVPREHTVGNGVGVSTSVYGVGIQTFYGNDEYWAARLSYSLWDQSFGLSVDGDEAVLVDISSSVDVVGFPITTSLEYDLSDDSDGSFWLRSVITPAFAKGASLLLGFNSDDEVLYGIKYKCSDKCFLTTELSAEGDTSIRVSYSF